MSIIGHDIEHCHCARCERLNRSLTWRLIDRALRLGPALMIAFYFVYHIVLWAIRGLPGFTRIGGI